MNNLMWCVLVHLGTNLWYEEGNTRGATGPETWRAPASAKMRFDEKLWTNYLDDMKDKGVNTIILDVADALCYQKHPELSIEGNWSKEKMKSELDRMNKMGFEVIPKLNFSTTHDVWLKEYAYKVSTPEYYQVCKDIIDEICELFQPRYVHLGMDEEVCANQQFYDYVLIRQNDLWWHDFYYLVDCVEAHGARAMMWSDYARHRPEEFAEKCPKSVVQCVWYYYNKFYGKLSRENEIRVKPLKYLADRGFDLLPSGSVAYFDENLEMLTEYCNKKVPKERILGFAQTTWEAVLPQYEDLLFRGNKILENAKKAYES